MRRKHPATRPTEPELGAGARTREIRAAGATTWRLPTVAAVASALAIAASSGRAHAIVPAHADAAASAEVSETSGDAAADATSDARSDDAAAPDDDGGDACDGACPPPYDPPPLGGVQMPTRVHGGGCGCLSDRDGGESAASGLGSLAFAIAAVIARRRR
ncbi:MAG: hypothetical protein HYV09_40430 [Deltaproteobacteria bacterium]|nr:hypothetical protein [Deltaproteobacteria bacterium]